MFMCNIKKNGAEGNVNVSLYACYCITYFEENVLIKCWNYNQPKCTFWLFYYSLSPTINILVAIAISTNQIFEIKVNYTPTLRDQGSCLNTIQTNKF